MAARFDPRASPTGRFSPPDCAQVRDAEPGGSPAEPATPTPHLRTPPEPFLGSIHQFRSCSRAPGRLTVSPTLPTPCP